MIRPSLFALALVSIPLAGCGGGGGGGSHAATSLSITAPTTAVVPGGTVAFVAHTTGGNAGTVGWSASGGTITSGGIFTAPATQGTYTITATLGKLTATKTILVDNGIAIALTGNATPPLAIPLSKLSFTAAVTGASDKTVLWSVADSSGTSVANAIGTDGTFTAPTGIGNYTVVATSKADPTKTAKATVQVVSNVNVRLSWKGQGDVVLALRADKEPNTVANYVTLVNKGFYDGIIAHRYEAGFVFQWGDPLTKTLPLTDPSIGTGGPGYTIPFETPADGIFLSNLQYSLAMARSDDKDSAGSQVYINLVDNSATLDHTDTNQGYVVFGAVASGTDVVDALRKGDVLATAKVEAIAAPTLARHR